MQVVDIQDVKGSNINKDFILELGCMCTDSQIIVKEGKWKQKERLRKMQ